MSMVRCSNEVGGVRCMRYVRLLKTRGPQQRAPWTWTCGPCANGEKPYSPSATRAFGQQKQKGGKKK